MGAASTKSSVHRREVDVGTDQLLVDDDQPRVSPRLIGAYGSSREQLIPMGQAHRGVLKRDGLLVPPRAAW